MTTQERVVHAARGWIGTRFCHQGRVKKNLSHNGGVDCLGLLVGVAEECQLVSISGTRLMDYDELNYPHFPDTLRLQKMLETLLNKIPAEGIRPADILLLDIDGFPQHMGIVGSFSDESSNLDTGFRRYDEKAKKESVDREQRELTLIHAYAPARAVVEHDLDAYWKDRILSAFRIPI